MTIRRPRHDEKLTVCRTRFTCPNRCWRLVVVCFFSANAVRHERQLRPACGLFASRSDRASGPESVLAARAVVVRDFT